MVLTAPAAHQVLQRDITNQTVLSIVANSPHRAFDTAKVRATPRPGYLGTDTGWVTIQIQAVGTGPIAGNLTIVSGWYDFSIQISAHGAVIETLTVPMGLGEVFIVLGQSLTSNTTPTPATATNEASSKVSLAGVWSLATDPQPSATETSGSFIPSFCDQLAAHLSLPVGVLDVGFSGSSVLDWAPISGPTYLYAVRLLPAMQVLLLWRACLYEQGQADGILGTTAPTYVSRLESIIDQSRTDAGFAVPWLIARSTWNSGSPFPVIQGAQVTTQGYTGTFAGADSDTLDDTYRDSGKTHFTNAGAVSQATLWVNAVIAAFGW